MCCPIVASMINYSTLIAGVLDMGLVDAMVRATDLQAFGLCREVAANDGLLVGGSSGLNVHASRVLSGEVEDGSVIVTVLPDNGVKYLSKIYNDEWLEGKGMGGAADPSTGADAAAAAAAGGHAAGEIHWRPGLEKHNSNSSSSDDIAPETGGGSQGQKQEQHRVNPAAAAAVLGSDLWSQESLHTELQFLEELAPRLVQYHRESVGGQERVHSRLQSPAELLDTFVAAGVPLSLAEGAGPG